MVVDHKTTKKKKFLCYFFRFFRAGCVGGLVNVLVYVRYAARVNMRLVRNMASLPLHVNLLLGIIY